MIKFTGKPKGELDLKRCYLPGVKTTYTCPAHDCGHTWKEDFDGDNFGYPVMNKKMDLYCQCPECDLEWEEKVIFNVSIEALKK